MTQFARGNTRAAKLSNEQVLEMRMRYFDEGWTQAQLSRHYGVNINTVGRIVRGESRQRVPMPEDPKSMLERLMALQAEEDAKRLDTLNQAIQKEYDTKVKPEKDLDRFANPEAMSRYGITKE